MSKKSRATSELKTLKWYRAIVVSADCVMLLRCAPSVKGSRGLPYSCAGKRAILIGNVCNDERLRTAAVWLYDKGIQSCHVYTNGDVKVFESDYEYTINYGDIKRYAGEL